MSAPKRAGEAVQDPNPKRSVEAADVAEDAPVRNSKDDEIRKLLRECSMRQRNYIANSERMLAHWNEKYERIQAHFDLLHRKNEFDKLLTEQTNKYKDELRRLENQFALADFNVKEMKEQEDKLEMAYQEIAEYKNGVGQPAGRIEMINQPPDVSNDQEYRAALFRVPILPPFDVEQKNLPVLRRNDLEQLNWTDVVVDWSCYSIHWGTEFEKAVECRELNEQVKLWQPKMQQALFNYINVQRKKGHISMRDKERNDNSNSAERHRRDYLEMLIRMVFEKKAWLRRLKMEETNMAARQRQREDLFKKVQEEMNSVSLKCPICMESFTREEGRCPKLFGTCGHTVCAACMKNSIVELSFTCQYCQASSINIPTNWALMDMIKETPPAPRQAPH